MNKYVVKRFFQVLFICLGAGSLVMATAFWFFTRGSVAMPALNIGESAPARTNFVILGVDDDGTRTDTIIVGTFNAETGAIDLFSVPRDTYVEMPEERLKILRAEGKWTPAGGGMKINAVHHYSGKEHDIEFTVAQLEDLFGIKIDYYARIDIEAFRYVVDAMGGVEFDVPQRMYYTDPAQGLYIDLYPGLQKLNGDQAEQLVRYRKPDLYNPQSPGYAEGDLQRNRVQQAFMKAVISQALSQNLISTTGTLISTVFKYVDTNFNITDAPKYIKYVKELSADNITGMSLPCDAVNIQGQSYVKIREPDAGDLIDSIFRDGEIVQDNSFGKSIIVLNGGDTKGKANEVRKTLEEAGFTVDSIGDYMGNQQDATRIYVRKRGMGEDLREFFNVSEIVIEPQTDCDIKIVIGLGN